ncbi:hypothetical protein [Planctomicrobium piriforme]|uniref:Uncharacterized protein n=1 Tax=Planctomicrobium piriforme TaxID=1576369 RepID=A0A1I3EBB3_9PLAN|nr:hypothetical protein [Planctomicrobium piriforme]SFH96235.1 hypothetical protein SAMN05421753_104150 [Planctomicrobium piriforme]
MRTVGAIVLMIVCVALAATMLLTEGEPMGLLRATTTVSGTGNEPGDVVTIIETVDGYVAPTTKTCWTRSGTNNSLGVLLNSAGEAYFGAYATDVNTALAEAVTAAINQLVASADGTICEDGCQSLSGEGSGSENGCTANVTAIVGSYEEGDDLCDPDSIGGAVTGLRITVTAPGTSGVDVESLVAALAALDYPDGSTLGTKFSDMLAYNLIFTPSISEGVQSLEVYGMTISYIPGVLLTLSTAFPGEWNFSATWSTASGTWESNGTVVASGVTATASYFDGFSTTDYDVEGLTDPLTLVNAPGDDLEITNEYLELNNGGGDPETYSPTSSSNFTGSGSVTVAYTDEHEEIVDPGTPHSRCMVHWKYVNVEPWQGDEGCTNRQELIQDSQHRNAPRLKAPPCIYPKNKVTAV